MIGKHRYSSGVHGVVVRMPDFRLCLDAHHMHLSSQDQRRLRSMGLLLNVPPIEDLSEDRPVVVRGAFG